MILLIDNYDSFSYNLVQLLGQIRPDIRVVRNDAVTVHEIRAMKPDHLVLSPGPGYPGSAGILEQAVRELAGELPILGVCLGHQGICEAFGGRIVRAERLMHGKQSRIQRTDLNSTAGECPLFYGLAEEFLAARYHSLVAEPASLPEELEAVAEDAEGREIMAVRHRKYPVYGLQFHPESIMTPEGSKILENFLNIRTTQAM